MFQDLPYYQKLETSACVFVSACTHRHTDTQTYRHTEAQTHRHTQTDTDTHRHTDTQTYRHTDIAMSLFKSFYVPATYAHLSKNQTR